MVADQTNVDDLIERLGAGLRAGQQSMADWQGGELAVSAVPGAGKSTGMAVAAAIAIARFRLHRQQQLVLVTFTRSAASNLKNKVRAYLKSWRLPMSAFTVNTLHSLALAIATNHPELSGIKLDEGRLLSESQKQSFIKKAVLIWVRSHPDIYGQLTVGQRAFDGEESEQMRRQMILTGEILPNLLKVTLDTAKSANLSPQHLQATDSSILQVAAQLYAAYNQMLVATGAFDYSDMILGAINALQHPEVRKSWRERTFAVFEDEAQDSSPLQTQLLEILADKGDRRNLVRVGDPNQAINSTFTTADPKFFNDFCDRCGQFDRLVQLDQAGRSHLSIINTANQMLIWSNQSQYARQERPFRPQLIRPVAPDDPQPHANPQAIGAGTEIYPPQRIDTIGSEMQMVSDRLLRLYGDDPELSMAILVKEHSQGKFVCDYLKASLKDSPLKLFDVEQRERRSRVPAEMLTVLNFLSRPHSPDHFNNLLRLLVERQRIPPHPDLNTIAIRPERTLYPTPLDPPPLAHICTALLNARLKLPAVHLMPFIAHSLDYDQGELATADKLNDRLEQQLFSDFRWQTILPILQDIVEGENFEAIAEEPMEDAYRQKGQVTVITYHKAKGLDWDAVFLPFVSDKLFPREPYVLSSHKFASDYPLPDTARAQIRALIHQQEIPPPDQAWERTKMFKQAEDLRLLYVGMTRAKRLLHISCAEAQPRNWNNLKITEKVCLSVAIDALLG